MSKLDKVKTLYPLVNLSILQKLYNEDWTTSKKYFPLMVKLWDGKKNGSGIFTSQHLIKTIKKFDELLPYITDKDIYSEKYSTLRNIESEIENAQTIKEEKTFNRDEHVLVLKETDDYIFLTPLTFRGSLKYGANTRWCTASKNDEATFTRYNKNGFLSYLISKNKKIKGNYEKLAFWTEEINSPFSGEIMIYNVLDDFVDDKRILEMSWDIETIFMLTINFRQQAYFKFKTKQAETSIKRNLQIMNGLNFDKLAQDIKIINDSRNRVYLESLLDFDAHQTIQKFITNIKTQIEHHG